MGRLRVTQVRSKIGIKPKHRGTLRALGLRRIDHTVELPDRPEIRGMVARVPHLVTVEEVDDSANRLEEDPLKAAEPTYEEPQEEESLEKDELTTKKK